MADSVCFLTNYVHRTFGLILSKSSKNTFGLISGAELLEICKRVTVSPNLYGGWIFDGRDDFLVIKLTHLDNARHVIASICRHHQYSSQWPGRSRRRLPSNARCKTD